MPVHHGYHSPPSFYFSAVVLQNSSTGSTVCAVVLPQRCGKPVISRHRQLVDNYFILIPASDVVTAAGLRRGGRHRRLNVADEQNPDF